MSLLYRYEFGLRAVCNNEFGWVLVPLHRGKLKPRPASWHCSSHKGAAASWLRKWKQDISGWLQVTMSDTLLRQTTHASGYGH